MFTIHKILTTIDAASSVAADRASSYSEKGITGSRKESKNMSRASATACILPAIQIQSRLKV